MKNYFGMGGWIGPSSLAVRSSAAPYFVTSAALFFGHLPPHFFDHLPPPFLILHKKLEVILDVVVVDKVVEDVNKVVEEVHKKLVKEYNDFF